VCVCVCLCVCVCILIIPNLFYREKVKGVPEELKILKANKHYLHATELLTNTGM